MINIYSKAEKAVRSTGSLLIDKEMHKKYTQKSGDCNFVTEVDLAVQEVLVKELIKIIPGSNIIAEESDKNHYLFNKPTWILDPVDGTTNLMHRYNHSAVSLALVLNGELSMGIIYNPYSNEMFLGIADQGSYLNGEKIKVTKLSVLKECLIGFGTTPYNRENAMSTFDIVSRVFMKSQEIRRSGSAALDIAYVASGRLDGFFELQLQPWDYAAGMVILKEAGGSVSNWKGEKPSLVQPDSIIATNGIIHEELIRMMGEEYL